MRRPEHIPPPTHRSRRFAGALICAAALLLAPTAVAAQSFNVDIASPADGATLDITNPAFYDAATGRFRFTGAIKVPSLQRNDYHVTIQGQDFDPAHTTSTTVPSGEPGIEQINFETWLLFPSTYDLFKGVTLTIEQRSTGKYKVDRITLLDLRLDGNIRPRRLRTDVFSALGVQLTATGVNALESTHLASLPQPDLADFNRRLTARATGPTLRVAQETRFKQNDKACVPISQAQDFLNTQAWRDVLQAAEAHYATYVAVKQGKRALSKLVAAGGPAGIVAGTAISLGAAVYQNLECVRELPFPNGVDPLSGNSQFEVCAGEIEGEVAAMAIDSVLDVDLGVAAGAITATDTTGPVRTIMNGRQRKLFIRWAEPHGACTIRPDVELTTADVPAVDLWASCPNLQKVDDFMRTAVKSTLADRPLTYTLTPDAGSGETLETAASRGAKFVTDPLFESVIPPSTCALAEFSPGATELIKLLAADSTGRVSDTWNTAAPYPVAHQTKALDDLLAPLEVGMIDPFDLDLSLRYAAVGVYAAAGDPDGVAGVMNTDVTRQGLTSGLGLFYTPATLGVEERQSLDGTMPDGRPFDLGYTVSTAFLNQVLRERTMDWRWLSGELVLSWNDLGLTPPPGEAGTAPAVLDEHSLPALHPAFGGLGLRAGDRVRLWLQPFTQPVINIPADPPVAPGRAPITYQMSRVTLTLEKKSPGGVWENVLRFMLDFYDEGFRFDLDPHGGPYLRPSFGQSAQLFGQPIIWRLPGCQLQTPTGSTPNCSAEVMSSVLTPALQVLQARLLGMVSDIPAPQKFDAAGTSASPHYVEQLDTYVGDQKVTFFARLVPVSQ